MAARNDEAIQMAVDYLLSADGAQVACAEHEIPSSKRDVLHTKHPETPQESDDHMLQRLGVTFEYDRTVLAQYLHDGAPAGG